MTRRRFFIAFLKVLAAPFVLAITVVLMLGGLFLVICPLTLIFLLPRMLVGLVLGIAGLFTGFVSPRHGRAIWDVGNRIMDGGEHWLDRIDPVFDVACWLPDRVYP